MNVPNFDPKILASMVLSAGAVEMREVPKTVSNDEVEHLPREKQPFLYSSGNWGPGYVTVKSLVARENILDWLIRILAHKIMASLGGKDAKLDFMAGNITGGVIPGFKLSMRLARLLYHPVHFAYVGGSRKESTLIPIVDINKDQLESNLIKLSDAIVQNGRPFSFVAGVVPGGMIPGYMLSIIFSVPFVYIRDQQKKGGQKELITGIEGHPLIKKGDVGLVVGLPKNFLESSNAGCDVLTSAGYKATSAGEILQRFDQDQLGYIGDIECKSEGGDLYIPLQSVGVDVEELVNFAQTTCNSVEALRNAGYPIGKGYFVDTAATILYYDNPEANKALREHGINMVYLFTLSDLLSAAEEDGKFPAKAIADYRSFLQSPLKWQEERGLKPVKGGGTL